MLNFKETLMKTLKTLAALVLASAVLIVWQDIYSSSCLMLIFPVMLTIIIMFGFIETEMNRKRCFAQCYSPRITKRV